MKDLETHFLFVYGTLLLPENEYARFLLENSTFVSDGQFPGELFDLGAYPGAVYNDQLNEFVCGKIFKMHEPELVLARLDYYEGLGEAECEYERLIIEVRGNNGFFHCHGYIYIQSTVNSFKIRSGDYVGYLSSKP